MIKDLCLAIVNGEIIVMSHVQNGGFFGTCGYCLHELILRGKCVSHLYLQVAGVPLLTIGAGISKNDPAPGFVHLHHRPYRAIKTTQASVDMILSFVGRHPDELRSEEHTSELQSLMRISYAVFCLNKKTINNSQKHRVHEC